MKVLFVKDALPTAMAGDVLEVKNGFARNYLMPQGIAVLATDAVIESAAELMQQAVQRREMAKQEWTQIAENLGEQEITLSVLSTPTGKLYGSITRGMVAEEVKKLLDRDILAKNVQITTPIRTVGNYKVRLNLHEGVTASLKLVVASDGEVSEEMAAAESQATAEQEATAESQNQGEDQDQPETEAEAEGETQEQDAQEQPAAEETAQPDTASEDSPDKAAE